MYTQASTYSSDGEATRTPWCRLCQAVGRFFVSTISSRHGKRIIFLTTLYFHVARIERMNSEAVAKLNAIMELARREEAFTFPMMIRGLVWDGTQIDQALSEVLLTDNVTEERVREVSERIVSMSHKRFRFGRFEDMVQQVQKLILNGHQIAHAA